MIRILSCACLSFESAPYEAFDANQDLDGSLGSGTGLWGDLVGIDELADACLESSNASMTSAADLLAGELGKPTLDEIEPGAVGESEVEMEAGFPRTPIANERYFSAEVSNRPLYSLQLLQRQDTGG